MEPRWIVSVTFTIRRCGYPVTWPNDYGTPVDRFGVIHQTEMWLSGHLTECFVLQTYSKGTAYGKKAWRRAHPIEEDEDYWDDIGEVADPMVGRCRLNLSNPR